MARRIVDPDRRAIAAGIVCDALVERERLVEAISALDGSPEQLLTTLPRWASQFRRSGEHAVESAILRGAEALTWTDRRWAEIQPALAARLTPVSTP